MQADYNTQPKCSCGRTSRRVSFSTFSYDYCDICKLEVSTQKAPSPPVDNNFDVGYPTFWGGMCHPSGPTKQSSCRDVYPKGSNITCESCKKPVGTLLVDMPKIKEDRVDVLVYGTGYYTGPFVNCCGSFSSCRLYNTISLTQKLVEEYYLEGFGWV